MNDPFQVTRSYRAGFAALLRSRWLLIVPAALYGAEFLLDIPQRLHTLDSMAPRRHDLFARQGFLALAGTHFGHGFWLSRLYELIEAPAHVNEAYYSLFYGFANVTTSLTLTLLIIGAFFMPLFADARETSFAQNVLRANLVIFLACLGIAWANLSWTAHPNHSMFNSWIILGQGFVVLSIVSFLEGWFLSGVWMTLRQNIVTPSIAFRLSLTQFKPLYLFNLFWVTLYLLLHSAWQIVMFFMLYGPAYARSVRLDRLNILQLPAYVAPWLILFTVCMPFFLIAEDIGLGEAWKRNLLFIRRYWPGYFLFMLSGMILRSVSVFLRQTAIHVLNPLSFIAIDVELLLGTLEMLSMTWFFVSLYGWFWDCYATTSETWTLGRLNSPLPSLEPESAPSDIRSSPKVCVHCGAPREPDSNFCDQCGESLR